MAYNIILLSKAIDDFDASVEWYKSIDVQLAKQFISEVDATFNLIAINPLLFPCVFNKYRMVNTQKFPFKIVYNVNENRIVIVAIFHHKRNPKKIISRIK